MRKLLGVIQSNFHIWSVHDKRCWDSACGVRGKVREAENKAERPKIRPKYQKSQKCQQRIEKTKFFKKHENIIKKLKKVEMATKMAPSGAKMDKKDFEKIKKIEKTKSFKKPEKSIKKLKKVEMASKMAPSGAKMDKRL